MKYNVLLGFIKRAKCFNSVKKFREKEQEMFDHLVNLNYKDMMKDACEHSYNYYRSCLLSKMKSCKTSKGVMARYPHLYLYGVLSGYIPKAENDLQEYDCDDVLYFDISIIAKLAKRYDNLESFHEAYPKYYNWVRSKGELSNLAQMCGFDYHKWSNENLIALADKYTNVSNFRYTREDAYQELISRNLTSKFTESKTNIGGYKPTKPGILYVYAFSMFTGFGITNDFKKRNYEHVRNFKKAKVDYKLLRIVEGCGKLIQQLESRMKKTLPIWNGEIPGFLTEAVHYTDQDLVMNEIENFCKQHKELRYENC